MKKVSIDKNVYNLPESWEELTIKQFIEMDNYDNRDYIRLLSVLLQAPYGEVFSVDPVLLKEKISPIVSWISEEYNFESLKVPEEINIYDKDLKIVGKVKIPKDIRLKTFGQKIHFDEAMSSSEGSIIMKIPYIVAIYLYPEYSKNKFDEDSVVDFKNNHINYCRAVDIYAVACFFLDNWQKFIKKKMSFSVRIMNRRNWPRVLRSLKSLVS